MNYYDDITRASNSLLPWEDLSGKNILITGATGLIGSGIVDILMSRADIDYDVWAAGRNTVRASYRFAGYENNSHFHFMEYDVTKPIDSVENFHFIISAASGANPSVYRGDPVGVMKANFLGVDSLLSYGMAHVLERLVYVSSGDIYGGMEGCVPEEIGGYVNPLDYKSCYVSSKLAVESLCMSYATQYGIHTGIVRPCHTYGPFFTETDTRAASQFIRDAVSKKKITMKSAGNQVRSWCYVPDCALGILYVLLKGAKGDVYNLAGEETCSIREFAEYISEITGCDIVFDENVNVSIGQNASSVLDITKIRRLGWKPGCSVKEGLLHSINQLKGV